LGAGRDNFRAIQSDLFTRLAEEDAMPLFDAIFWNAPFGYSATPVTDMLERTVRSYHYKNIAAYAAEAQSWISHSGKVLLGFSPDIGEERLLESVLGAKKLKTRLIAEEVLPRTRGESSCVRYQLLEVGTKP
jgi:hypothetical protein